MQLVEGILLRLSAYDGARQKQFNNEKHDVRSPEFRSQLIFPATSIFALTNIIG